ncbi:MAG: TolC family protein [Bacteroidales bacterium]|jgi:outer membrane protein TolC|nr:TolC family protein [Bacteroidales bacterium]
MRKVFFAGCLFSCFFAVQGQVRLEDCQRKAKANYPLVKQYKLLEQSRKYSVNQIFKAYIPQVALSGKMSWQSDVTAFPEDFAKMLDQFNARISFPGKDQYNVAVEVSQTVLDGGSSVIQKEMTNAQSDLDFQELEVNLYALNEQINQLFFSVLLLDEQIRQNVLLNEELARNYALVQSYMENGVGQQSDLDAIQVEMLSSKQRDTEMKASRKACIAMLAAFIGEPVSEEAVFEKPNAEFDLNEPLRRPEFAYFDMQIDLIGRQTKMLWAKAMPRLSLFAKGVYGNPGLNMFESGFTPYFVGGVQLLWNFGVLYSFGDEKNTIRTQKKQAEMRRDIFLFNMNQKLIQKNSEVEKMQQLLENDMEIIRLREDIQKAADAKVENGTMSINDLLHCINATSAARQSKSYHEIQLLLAVWQLKTERGLHINN